MKQLTALVLAALVTLVFLVVGYYGAVAALYVWVHYRVVAWVIIGLVAAYALVMLYLIQRRKP